MIVAQAYSSTGGPGGQWGAEFSSAIPSMELFEGEAMEMAVESGVIRDKDYVHVGEAPSVLVCGASIRSEAGAMGAGWPTLGYFTKPSGAIVVNTGCTDWACGLRRDLVVQRITMNVMRKLSVSCLSASAGREESGLAEAFCVRVQGDALGAGGSAL